MNSLIKKSFMKNIIKITLLAAICSIAYSCEDPDAAPVVTFDSATKGAYPRLLEEGDKLMNLFDLPGSEYIYSVEFVDQEKGGLVSEYILYLEYDGVKAYGPEVFRTYTSADFATNENGYVGIVDIGIGSAELLSAAGISEADLLPGDNFTITSKLVLGDGSEYSGDNSASTISSSAFRGHFDFILPASCPSDLEATLEYTATTWCGNTVTGTVTVSALGGGAYEFDDWSFGGYKDCYACCVATGPEFTETCAEVEFTGFVDSYGDTWEFVSSIDGEEWTIFYNNAAWGETGTAVITWPGGVPFTLAD